MPRDLEAAALLSARLPRPLVFTNGVFDVLHAGHVFCLEEARRHGRSLVVGINGDASARRLGKGPGRPVNDEDARQRIVAALSAVSATLLFDEDTPLELLQRLRPDVYVKGGDYAAARLAEAEMVSRWGGCTVIVPRAAGAVSTSSIIQRIRALGSAGA